MAQTIRLSGPPAIYFVLPKTDDEKLPNSDYWGLPDIDGCSIDEFRQMIELSGIWVFPQERDGIAHIAYDFSSQLECEHGYEVLMHRDEPLDFGGIGDLHP